MSSTLQSSFKKWDLHKVWDFIKERGIIYKMKLYKEYNNLNGVEKIASNSVTKDSVFT